MHEKVISLLWFESKLTDDQKKKVDAALEGTGVRYVDDVRQPIVVEMRVLESN